MKNKEFKVLLMDINKKTYEEYDILPYFRREWKIRPFGRDEKYKKISVTTKPQLREWVDVFAKYQFWSRCDMTVSPRPSSSSRTRMNHSSSGTERPV